MATSTWIPSHYYRAIDPIPWEEERELLRRIQESDDQGAFDRLVRANMRWVMMYARRYCGRGVPYPDLVSAGAEGLVVAIKRFDLSRGEKLFAYSVWWIDHMICEAVARESRSVRQSIDAIRDNHIVSSVIRAWEQAEGRTLNDADVLEQLRADGIVSNTVGVMHTRAREISMDSPIDGDDSRDALPVRGSLHAPAEDVDAPMDHERMAAALASMLSALPARTQTIIRRYYGLGQDAETCEQIAADLKLTRERIRQILEEVLAQLRGTLRRGGSAEALTICEYALNAGHAEVGSKGRGINGTHKGRRRSVPKEELAGEDVRPAEEDQEVDEVEAEPGEGPYLGDPLVDRATPYRPPKRAQLWMKRRRRSVCQEAA